MNLQHDPESDRPRDVFRHYVGDIVYGANDGLITTFTVVSGVAGAQLASGIVLIIGFVNLIADGFSMGASNYLAIRSMAGPDRGVREPLLHAGATMGSFVLVGVVPLVAYLIPAIAPHAFVISCVATGVSMFAVGASRSIVVGRSWVICGLEMFAIGAVAAAVAYSVGMVAQRLTGIAA